jgi:phosphatidylserine/phosphatidylglycerophosphate/cardiolipin synthase-like enzyme
VSTSVTGKVVDVDNPSNGFSGLPVVVRDTSAIVASQLGTTTTGSDGSFTVTIAADSFSGTELGPRQLEVSIRTAVVGRLLYLQTYPDSDSDTTTIDTVSLKQADVTGWAVTLPGTSNALPVWEGTALQAFVDDKTAWSAVNAAMKNATNTISVMQLALDMPRSYQANAADESPEVVLDFPDGFDGTTSPTTANDPTTFPRPERTMVTAAQGGRAVKVLISSTGDAFINFIVTVVHVWNHLFHGAPYPDAGEVQKYFTKAGTTAKALTFTTTGISVVHAKAVLVDAVDASADLSNAFLLGSPFEQSYWDTGNHQVYEARRGSCSGEPVPVHDVSIGIRGPLVKDLQDQFVAHWSKADDGSNPAVALTNPPAAITTTTKKEGEYVAAAQLVRTVNVDTLPTVPNGEVGLLEAYLRAIENATDYIYFENQYFTNETVGRALVAALNKQPNLQVILMVNVVPDMPFYPHWQTELFARIRKDAPSAATRFGVFTAWSHEAASADHKRKDNKDNNPLLMPNYLHTKTAIVDGKWATIGSGNLDGASLDEFQIMRPFIGVNRNDELNCVVYDGVDNHDSSGFADALRVALWSEHLGIPTSDSRLTAPASPPSNWLTLWNTQAAAKLAVLVNSPTTIDPNDANGRVLAFPSTAPGDDAKFIAAAGINAKDANGKVTNPVCLLEQTTAFNFHTGKWADASS